MRNFKNSFGFTLIEVIVVVAIVGILAAIALPNLVGVLQGAKFREAAQGMAAMLREARSQAVNHNFEYQIHFEVANSRYRLGKGNSNSGSTSFDYGGWKEFQGGIVMAAPTSCDDFATPRYILFSPNGSSTSGDSDYICVMDGATAKYKVGVSSPTTGRIVIE